MSPHNQARLYKRVQCNIAIISIGSTGDPNHRPMCASESHLGQCLTRFTSRSPRVLSFGLLPTTQGRDLEEMYGRPIVVHQQLGRSEMLSPTRNSRFPPHLWKRSCVVSYPEKFRSCFSRAGGNDPCDTIQGGSIATVVTLPVHLSLRIHLNGA